jgi:hypothetical protein
LLPTPVGGGERGGTKRKEQRGAAGQETKKRQGEDKVERERTEEKGKTDFPRTYMRFLKTAGTCL